MKAMKGIKSMPKSGICAAIASKTELAPKAISEFLDAFVDLATAETKKTGKFTIPGLCMFKTRIRPARKAGKSMAFGKVIKVKARKATKIVKAYCTSALKQSI